MKRFISIVSAILLLSAAVFAGEYDDGDEYDDGFVYEQNGAGDRFLKVDLGVNFADNLMVSFILESEPM